MKTDMPWQKKNKKKRRTSPVYKTQHRKLKTEQHKPHENLSRNFSQPIENQKK